MLLVRRVVGNSMNPALYEGAIILARQKVPTKGDVVVAKVRNREVIKRIVRIENGLYSIQGDNSVQSTDSRQYGPIEGGDIIGVVWKVFNNLKK